MNHLESVIQKIVSFDDACNIVSKWKSEGEKVVFTNGCFDIIHKGHVFYLSQARELGTKLIVGLNTDESIARLKGPDRPVKELESRALTLASFEYIDLVIPFSEDTPLKLISTLLPNVLVKGSDYEIANIVGAKEVLANGGEVKTIDFVKGFSSTNYFKKLKK